MKNYVVVQIETSPLPPFEEEITLATDLGDFNSFKSAVTACKEFESVFGKNVGEIIEEDYDNNVFIFKNPRPRYNNSEFSLMTREDFNQIY